MRTFDQFFCDLELLKRGTPNRKTVNSPVSVGGFSFVVLYALYDFHQRKPLCVKLSNLKLVIIVPFLRGRLNKRLPYTPVRFQTNFSLVWLEGSHDI